MNVLGRILADAKCFAGCPDIGIANGKSAYLPAASM
jgi:hypothetical protein